MRRRWREGGENARFGCSFAPVRRSTGIGVIYSSELVPPDLPAQVPASAATPMQRAVASLAAEHLRLKPIGTRQYAVVRDEVPAPAAAVPPAPDAAAPADTLDEVSVYASRYSFEGRQLGEPRLFNSSEIQRVPGAQDDPVRALRSLPGMALRYAAHDVATRQLAAWCQTRPEFAQVLHPALPDSPGHAHWKALCGDGMGRAAGLFSVIFKPDYSQKQVDAFVDGLDFFGIGYSWGGPESLAVPYNLGAIRPGWPAHIAPGRIVRFSVGLENADDLQADLARALGKMVA